MLVSSGPEIPDLERWLQRQLSQDGERLQRLRERLWQGLAWQRTYRVLMLGGASLLWSLDPLAAVADGGLTILCSNQAEHERLMAQLQLLDPLQRPQLIVGDDTFAKLAPDHHFEVVAGRLNRQDMGQRMTTQLLQQLDQRCPAGSQIRLLLSDADLGPTEALLQLCEPCNLTPEEQGLLNGLLTREADWMQKPGNRRRCSPHCQSRLAIGDRTMGGTPQPPR